MGDKTSGRRTRHPTPRRSLRKHYRTPDSTQLAEKQTETTRHKGKQEERQAGRQGRQDLGKAGTPSNTERTSGGGNQGQWETKGENGTWGDDGREGGHTIQAGDTIQHRHICRGNCRPLAAGSDAT